MTSAPAGDGRNAANDDPPPEPQGSDGGSRVSGQVRRTGGGAYAVALDGDGGTVEASLRGRLKRERRTGDRVVIGDRVALEPAGEAWTIEEVEPRTSEFVRADARGRRPRIVAANLDRVCVVLPASPPGPRAETVDRFVVTAESGGMTPILVANKIDVDGADAVVASLREVYEPIGYEVVAVSALDGRGIDRLTALLCEGSSALLGPSGAGKSTLLNRIDPQLDLRTGDLSRKTGRGTHTTVSSRLIPLACGGLVADTPGFSDVGLWEMAPEEVEHAFPEFATVESCRFRGCAHLEEPDCGVQAAVEEGGIAESRYDSYVTIRQAAQEIADRDPGSSRG